MKFKKILVTGFSESALDENVWKKIRSLTESVVFEPDKNVDCLFCRFNKVDQKLIGCLPHLRYIGLLATGTGPVDLIYAKRKGITVCNIPGYATESVAEWVFALLLEHLRTLEKAKHVARSGDFSGDGFTATEISGKKFGIIGLGRIGLRVAQLAKTFGAHVSYWSKHRKPEAEKAGIAYQSIDQISRKSDILSLHALTTKETEHILNKSRINALKKGAIVINVSGMEQVDTPALASRLKKDDITFLLDHPDEMDKKDIDILKRFPNCIIYPPIGFITSEARVNKQAIFVSNLENFLKGKPTNKVN